MTFEEYVRYASSAENLAREAFGGYFPDAGSMGAPRRDNSAILRERHAKARLDDHQVAAIRWLAAQPGGPAKMLVISEDWSSDCRRDVPMLARLAQLGGLEMRIFPRDGHTLSSLPVPDPKESPYADVMTPFLRKRDGQTFQSIPVAAFFTKNFEHLYTYMEFPQIYRSEERRE